ncbi:MAG TPA: hypothetical protein VGG19_03970 [Tepidisphaeraceae bacterium]|jgi:hypothetical protein
MLDHIHDLLFLVRSHVSSTYMLDWNHDADHKIARLFRYGANQQQQFQSDRLQDLFGNGILLVLLYAGIILVTLLIFRASFLSAAGKRAAKKTIKFSFSSDLARKFFWVSVLMASSVAMVIALIINPVSFGSVALVVWFICWSPILQNAGKAWRSHRNRCSLQEASETKILPATLPFSLDRFTFLALLAYLLVFSVVLTCIKLQLIRF